MARFIPRECELTTSMESLIPSTLPQLIRNEFTGQYEVSMEDIGSALAAIKKWFLELGAKIKSLFTADGIKVAAARASASSAAKKAESANNSKPFNVEIGTILRGNKGKLTLNEYRTALVAAQKDIIVLLKTLANNHNTIYSALRNKETTVNLPDIGVQNINRHMDISSNGQTISVTMRAGTISLIMKLSDIPQIGDILDNLASENKTHIDPVLRKVAEENRAIAGMANVDPQLMQLAGTLQVQIIKLANICKSVFIAEINRTLIAINPKFE